MKIPASFELLCYTITVERGHVKNNDCAEWRGGEDRIVVAADLDGVDAFQAFLHELMHGVFERLGYGNLSDNERFVDTTAAVLAQVFKTARYE